MTSPTHISARPESPPPLVAAPHRALRATDLEGCQHILRRGSKSFYAASLLLPSRIRAPAAGLYAFCRVADDAVDDAPRGQAREAVASLHARLDAIFAGRPADDPVDRAFAEVVHSHRVPAAIPRALVEGFAWDAADRRYETLDELEGYCARVASTVGVMMTLLMGPRQPEVIARACDLGLAMQLTNIARDVGEDARAGRIYLPLSWLREAGIDPDELVHEPAFSRALGDVVQRLLQTADRYYQLANVGISMLPPDSRVAIRAASLIYRDIGRVIAANDFDSVSTRAYTSRARKIWLLLRATAARWWRRRSSDTPARPATGFLVDACTTEGAQ